MPLGNLARRVIAFTLSTALAIAQTPTVQDLSQQATALAETLKKLADLDQPGAAQKQELADAKAQLAALVAAAKAATDWTVDHFLYSSGPLLPTQPEAALAIAEAGAAKFPDARFLQDQVGFALLGRVANDPPRAVRLAGLETAKAAFTKALAKKPDTFHAHIGLMQTLDLLGDVNGALRELDVVVADEAGRQAATDAWGVRASLLLRSGKPKDALAAIAAEAPADTKAHVRPLLQLRAHALAKDAANVAVAAKALLAVEDTPRMHLEIADALFFIGDKVGAAKELAKLPPLGKWATEEERIGQICTNSGAALAAYWKATDVTPKGPLRAALTKALDHKFLFMDPGAKPKPKEVDLSASPLAMANLLQGAMAADEEWLKEWGNRTLLVASLQAIPTYKPTALETGILAQVLKNSPSAADIPALVNDARWRLGDPRAACALGGVHAMERLVPQKPAGK